MRLRRKPQELVGSSESNIIGASFDKALSCLEEGRVISFPTETYYGLGVDPFNETALEKLFTIKRRDKNKAILVLIGDVGMLSQLAEDIPRNYLPLMKKHWPGPLTLLFPAQKQLSHLLTGGTDTIGVRISSCSVVQNFFKLWSKPITATSANLSGELPAENAKQVFNIFGNNVDYIFDGGATPAGLCSTIIGCTGKGLSLVRRGQVKVGLKG